MRDPLTLGIAITALQGRDVSHLIGGAGDYVTACGGLSVLTLGLHRRR